MADEETEYDYDLMERPESKDMWVDKYDPRVLDDRLDLGVGRAPLGAGGDLDLLLAELAEAVQEKRAAVDGAAGLAVGVGRHARPPSQSANRSAKYVMIRSAPARLMAEVISRAAVPSHLMSSISTA